LIRNLLFELRYLMGETPWDTGISPPELIDFLENHPPGRALDLGCGTGTNAITISKYEWEVVGVDASNFAIRRAQEKTLGTCSQVDFRRLDVSRLRGIRGKFNLILDIGCFHSLSTTAQARYIKRISQLIHPEGMYLLYAWIGLTEGERAELPSEDGIEQAFSPIFRRIDKQLGTEGQQISAWYRMRVESA
jgi:cyclopropane fatty-acyl-phospholipid synthase-like methyltransferase